jgi:hypothetical protein
LIAGAQTDRELKKEVRKLDSELKTLVYENYSKFISATDTIRKMKSNVTNMESEMNRLAAGMERLTEHTRRIEAQLEPRRAQMQALGGQVQMLRKRQFLFALPTTLKRCIELESYGEAIAYWRGCEPTLREHPGLFRTIVGECEEVLRGLRELLLQRAQAPACPVFEAVDHLRLLLALGEPPAALAPLFARSRGEHLDAALTRASFAAAAADTPPSLPEFVARLNTVTAPSLPSLPVCACLRVSSCVYARARALVRGL